MKHPFRFFSFFSVTASVLFGWVATTQAAIEIDPLGDTFGFGPVQLDIINVQGDYSAGTVTITVTYSGLIAPPSAGAPNSVIGFIDLDTDQNPATGGNLSFGGPVPGGNSWINLFLGLVPPPTIALGDEFYVDLLTETLHAGFVDIIRTSDDANNGTVPIVFAGASFSLSIPFAVLGGDDGIINYGVLTGTFAEPTDRAPNGDAPFTTTLSTAPVPEPASLAIWSVGLVAAGLARLRRRRRMDLLSNN